MGFYDNEIKRLYKNCPRLLCKKMRKENTPAEAADTLEEDEQEVIRIYKVAERFAPDYDVEAIYRKLEKGQIVSAVSLE